MKNVPPPKSLFVRVLRIIGVLGAVLLFILAVYIYKGQTKVEQLNLAKRASVTAQYLKEVEGGQLARPADMERYFSINNNRDGSFSISVRTSEMKNFRYAVIPEGNSGDGKWNWTFKEVFSEK